MFLLHCIHTDLHRFRKKQKNSTSFVSVDCGLDGVQLQCANPSHPGVWLRCYSVHDCLVFLSVTLFPLSCTQTQSTTLQLEPRWSECSLQCPSHTQKYSWQQTNKTLTVLATQNNRFLFHIVHFPSYFPRSPATNEDRHLSCSLALSLALSCTYLWFYF